MQKPINKGLLYIKHNLILKNYAKINLFLNNYLT